MTETATGPIVCGYDGSQDSRRAVGWAASRARELGTPLEVVSADRAVGRVVAFDDTARANVEGAMRDQLADLVGDVPTTYRVIADSPVGALVEAGRGGSAIVVGSRGLTVREDFAMGSTSAGVVEHATCPVIVITPHAPADPTEGPVVLASEPPWHTRSPRPSAAGPGSGRSTLSRCPGCRGPRCSTSTGWPRA